MRLWNILLASALIAVTPSSAIGQDEAPPETDSERILDTVEVDEDNATRRRLPTTGTLNFEPLPVRMSGSPPIMQHAALELILRPVRIGADGIYELDVTKGSDFTSVDVELSIDKVIVGSRLPLAKNGKRTVELPEAIYAITEIRYLVFNQIGRVFDPDDPFGNPITQPKQDHRFCMAERAIAFDIKNGETTDLGRLIIRAVERGFRKSDREHRPILGADAEFLPVSNSGFRNKAPEMASAGIIEFEDTEPLCRESSIRAPGWFTPEEMSESLSRFTSRLETEIAEDG